MFIVSLRSSLRRSAATFLAITGLAAFLGLPAPVRAAFTATYDFAAVTASSGATDPTAVPVVADLTMGSFTATGASTNPNAGGRFSFTNWATGGVNGNDSYAAHTGSVNTGQYYSVTLTPQPGFALNLTALTFAIQRSGTGIRTYAVRSNAGGDAFASNLPASISPANANLSVQTGNVFYWALDANTAALNGSTVTLTGADFQNVTAPVTFRFYGWNAEGSGGTFSIDNVVFTGNVVSVGGPVPPTITTPPSSQTVTEGAIVQFTVAVNGTAPFSYQWRKGTSPLANAGIVSGALSDTLKLNGVALGDSGNYNVVVTNAGGTATSASATLTVNPALQPPSITAQPAPQSVVLGGTATFSVGVGGTAPFTYQWRKNGSPLGNGGNILGATGPTLTISPVNGGDVASYDVVVTNAVSPAATSNAVPLTLSALVTPAGQVAYVGGSYLQSFDTLPSAGSFTLAGEGPIAFTAAPITASGLGGWSLAKYDGTGAVALFRVDAGTSTSGGIDSYGAVSASDRALGSVSSGSTVSRFGAVLINSTGRTITEFTLGYTGEQWRRGSASANTLAFDYAVGGTNINNGEFIAAPALSFTAPVTTGSGVALDGNLAANRVAITGTVTGLNWAPGQTLVLRWTDVDDGGSDDGLAVDNLGFSTPVATSDILPAVVYTTPANGTVNIATNTAVSVTFNEAVNFTTSSFTLAGASSGLHAATLSGGPVDYTLMPTTPFAEGETVTLTIAAAQVTDAATSTQHPGADFSASFFTFSNAPLPIHVVQSSGSASPFAGYPVTVQGVVVASFQAPEQIGGYYIETPDALHDANPATSEGIFVFDNLNSVTVGDLVTVTGTITEYGSAPVSQTEVAAVTAFTKVGSGNALPTPASVTLPFPATGHAERYEGMLVTFPQSLAVTDNYELGHFGEVVLSNGVLPIPTNIVAPGAPAQAQAAANRLNQILLDDGLSTINPSPTPYLSSADPSLATRRTGSTATGVTGILDNKFGLYVVEPTAAPTFVDANPRTAAPAVSGRLHVAIGNVLNFFNGDGLGGGYPTSRGATNPVEYQRQRAKMITGITAIAPDIMGLTEVENDGFGPLSAIADIVNGLNAVAPAGTTYALVDGTGVEITTDVIHVAFIYRQETVELVGVPVMLSHPAFNNLARNPLAQTFREKSTGGKLTVCINHFRAKASVAPGPGNADSGDGQGNNNALRVLQSNALTAWLATDPTGSGDADFLIIGDLNAYAKEDPITAIEGAGYINLTEMFEGAGGYSYAFNGEFGHLDHALANPALTAQVVGAATWHVNSDEPVYYDYNTEDKNVAQLAINTGTPYRYSDHDPVVIGIDLTAPPVITAGPVPQTVTVGDSVTFSVVANGAPAPSYQWRFNGIPIDGATSATFTLSAPLTANAGSYDVVVTNSVGSVTSDAVIFTVNKATAVITLGNLTQMYTGDPREVTVTTVPGGLDVELTYDGDAASPVNAGSYAVVATIRDDDYEGSVAGTLRVGITALIRHLDSLNGGIHGSVQVNTAEAIALNGNAWISGNLLVPGMPEVRLNGKPTYSGTTDGTGAINPSGYKVTLNGNATLQHVVRRTNPLALPVVAAPPAPAGTRTVSLNNAGQSAGDFATVRNLTLNGNAGQVTVPAGTYGNLVANGNSSLVLGVSGSTTPAVYNLQGLTLNGNSRLQVAGPVIINLANGITLNGSMGDAGHPEWLEVNLASGGVTLNGNVVFDGYVTAPGGTVVINGNSVLNGGVTADRLTINGKGALIEVD